MYYLYIIYLLKKIEAGKTSKEDEQVNFHQDKCGGAKVQVSGHRSGYRSQATGQVTGHRPHARSQVRPQATHKNNRQNWTKLFLIDILLYKNKTSQGTSITFFLF